MSLRVNSNGKIITSSSGKPIECYTCPCDPRVGDPYLYCITKEFYSEIGCTGTLLNTLEDLCMCMEEGCTGGGWDCLPFCDGRVRYIYQAGPSAIQCPNCDVSGCNCLFWPPLLWPCWPCGDMEYQYLVSLTINWEMHSSVGECTNMTSSGTCYLSGIPVLASPGDTCQWYTASAVDPLPCPGFICNQGGIGLAWDSGNSVWLLNLTLSGNGGTINVVGPNKTGSVTGLYADGTPQCFAGQIPGVNSLRVWLTDVVVHDGSSPTCCSNYVCDQDPANWILWCAGCNSTVSLNDFCSSCGPIAQAWHVKWGIYEFWADPTSFFYWSYSKSWTDDGCACSATSGMGFDLYAPVDIILSSPYCSPFTTSLFCNPPTLTINEFLDCP